ncbi:SDR family oxidoreductase [Mycobacterium sp. URHD0025]|uniref:SDR family oxidoreductase n=1 Tax=Mycobacterium sp. URHD0025 TaxID=1298864 RepID=UPI0003FEA63A|nr:SDR family oxidoreductase [Mycobacterium sp. URHD0025]
MTTILITGANKGLGYETARQLIAAGHTIYLGCRDAQRGQDAAQKLGARLVQLDVTDDDSVSTAAQLIEELGGLDVLVNNAGVEGRGAGNAIVAAEAVTAETMREVFDTNVFGLIRATHAFLPLLQRSSAPVIVNVSSSLGSMSLAESPESPTYFYPGVAYPASKSAVNMITVQFAKQFPAMRVNAVEPGYTDTDLNGHTGTQTVEEGARIIVEMAQTAPDGPTGGYFSAHGPVPW